MTSFVIVDTDVLIDLGRNISDAVACLQEIQQHSSRATSVVSQMELIVGCRNKQELRAVEELLARFYIINLDPSITSRAVELVRLYRLSHGLQIPDALIAATALELNQPLVTKNFRHFRFITGLNLLHYPKPFTTP